VPRKPKLRKVLADYPEQPTRSFVVGWHSPKTKRVGDAGENHPEHMEQLVGREHGTPNSLSRVTETIHSVLTLSRSPGISTP